MGKGTRMEAQLELTKHITWHYWFTEVRCQCGERLDGLMTELPEGVPEIDWRMIEHQMDVIQPIVREGMW